MWTTTRDPSTWCTSSTQQSSTLFSSRSLSASESPFCTQSLLSLCSFSISLKRLCCTIRTDYRRCMTNDWVNQCWVWWAMRPCSFSASDIGWHQINKCCQTITSCPKTEWQIQILLNIQFGVCSRVIASLHQAGHFYWPSVSLSSTSSLAKECSRIL